MTSVCCPDLVAKTLRTLTKFSTWIPPGFLFETDILEDLTTKFFPYPAFRNPCLECLIEIVTISDQRYTSQIRSLFTALLDQLMSMITADQGMSYGPCPIASPLSPISSSRLRTV